MKKINTYPPLKAIQKAAEKLPFIWEEIAKSRNEMLQENEPLWKPDIYVTAWWIYERILQKAQYKVPEAEIPEAVATSLAVLAAWRQCKEVYRFAPEMEKMMYEQADCKLPIDTLLHLPFPSFYMETPQLYGGRYHGFFIAFDQTKEKKLLLRCIAIVNQSRIGFEFMEIKLEEGKTIRDGIVIAITEAVSEVISRGKREVAKQNIIEQMEYRIMILSRLCQLILYVTAQNADLEEHANKNHGNPPAKKIQDRYREIRNWEVGYRVVYNMARKEGDISQERKLREDSSEKHVKSSPAPHLRRGHWHVYWTGKRIEGKRKRIVRWIAPMFINCKSAEKLPVTINQINQRHEGGKRVSNRH